MPYQSDHTLMRSQYIPHIVQDHAPAGLSGGAKIRSLAELLQPLEESARGSGYLVHSPIGEFRHGRDAYRLERTIFLGPRTDESPIRLGVFAGIHGDEPASAHALIKFLLRLQRAPEKARGYQIFAYPVCNPTGFEDDTHASRNGHDLNHELWQGSQQPEVYFIEREIGVLNFHGVISIHAEDRAEFYATSRSRTIREALVQPALEAAKKFLPITQNSLATRCAAAEATGRHCHEGTLVNIAEIRSKPFEVVLEMPSAAAAHLQVNATVAALDRILAEYRPFLAMQQNI